MDFSFLLNNEEAEALIQLNPNFFETNVINIGLLIGILIYANKTSFSVGLENRQLLLFSRERIYSKFILVTILEKSLWKG